jgi:hypothetical protein
MKDEPLDAVYEFVERAYLRYQAGDLLIRCLEAGSPAPVQEIVEAVVLGGGHNLSVLREMLEEATVRKAQVVDDLHQVFSNFEASLISQGVNFPRPRSAEAVTGLSSTRFLEMLQELGTTDEEVQVACLQIFRDSRDLLVSIQQHVRLLDEIESYLRDWLWGLAYQLAQNQLTGDQSSMGLKFL